MRGPLIGGVWLCFGWLSAVEAPAPNPPTEIAAAGVPGAETSKPMAPLPAGVQWSIGSPTDDEQAYLELINRARANPPAEGTRLKNTTDPDVLFAYSFFSVNLTMMEGEFAAIAAAPPLAFHAQLNTAARGHCQYLFDNALQSHTGSGGSTLGGRLTAAGYPYSGAGECVYSYSESVFYGHAGFEVDWGAGGTGGMQAGRGHRANLHNAGFREIGIGVINGSKTVGSNTVGPQLVVQDLGTRSSILPMITGVVFTDGDSDSFYDPGEGVGNIIITVSGASFYAVTAGSGGYAVPVPGNGTYTVTFTAADGVTVISTQTITVSGGLNAKADVTNAPIGSGVPAPAPEIAVSRSGANVADGATDPVAGTAAGTPSLLTYVVANTGSATLTIGTQTISGQVNCTAVVTTAPAAAVAAAGTTTLEVTVTPTAAGAWSASLSLVTDDGDENPMNWTINSAPATGSGGSGGGGGGSGGGGGGCGAGGGTGGALAFGLLLALGLSTQRRRQR